MNSNYANVGKRILAFLVDSLIAEVFTSLVVMLIVLLAGEIWFWSITVIAIFVNILYFTLFEGSRNQATPGKQLMKLRVETANGAPVGYLSAFLRTVVFFFITVIDLIVGLFTVGNITLHDKITNTYVAEAAFASAAPVQSASVFSPYSSPSLVCLSGVYAGNAFPVGNGIILGTDPTVCQIVLPANSGVSRNHCKVSFDHGSRMFVLHDMGSTNGTFLDNGQQIPQGMPYAVNPGTKFYLASRNVYFETRL